MLTNSNLKPTVLVAANYSGMYGSERMLCYLVDALKEKFRLQLLINPAVAFEFNTIHDIPVIKQEFRVVSKSNKFSAVFDIYRWYKLLIKLKPKVLVLNISLIPAPLLVARLLGIQTVVFVRESLIDHPAFFRFYAKYLSLFAQHIVCNSRYTASMFNLPNVQVHIIHDCVDDTPLMKNDNSFEISFLYIGRISERKGIALFVRALASLNGQIQHRIKVSFVGDCMPDQKYFQRKMQDACASLENIDVYWLGYQTDPWQFGHFGTVLIAPSILPETFGLTVAESLSHGIPVIATKVGAYPELVVHGENGLLCELNVNDMATKIRAVLQLNKEQYGQLSDFAIASSKKFSKSQYEVSLKELFCSLPQL